MGLPEDFQAIVSDYIRHTLTGDEGSRDYVKELLKDLLKEVCAYHGHDLPEGWLECADGIRRWGPNGPCRCCGE